MMGAFLHTIPYDGGESTSIPPVSPIQDASSTTATVPRPSIADGHVNRRLHMYANRKLRISKLFERSGPSYTPYHIMAESRPLYLLFRLFRTPLRLRRRYHAHPSLVVQLARCPALPLRGQGSRPIPFHLCHAGNMNCQKLGWFGPRDVHFFVVRTLCR